MIMKLERDDVRDRLFRNIEENLCLEKGGFDYNSDLINDLGADSLDKVELIMSIEEEFDIEIYDEDADKINTVGDFLEYLRNKLC